MVTVLMRALLTSADEILKPIVTLKTFFLAAVSLIGVFVVVKALMEMFDAINAKDSSGIRNSILQLIGGLVIAGISGFLAFLGISS